MHVLCVKIIIFIIFTLKLSVKKSTEHMKGGLSTTTTFNFIFIDCESETPIGEKQRAGDIPNGGQVDITCSGGCIHFVEVIFNKCTIPY